MHDYQSDSIKMHDMNGINDIELTQNKLAMYQIQSDSFIIGNKPNIKNIEEKKNNEMVYKFSFDEKPNGDTPAMPTPIGNDNDDESVKSEGIELEQTESSEYQSVHKPTMGEEIDALPMATLNERYHDQSTP